MEGDTADIIYLDFKKVFHTVLWDTHFSSLEISNKNILKNILEI